MKLYKFLLLVLIWSVVTPFITIWSLNTAFKANIEYAFSTWFAALWLFSWINFGITVSVVKLFTNRSN